MRIVLLLTAVILAACASVVRFVATRRSRASHGNGRTHDTRAIASDTGVGEPIMLLDAQLGLRGKPDFLLRETGHFGERLAPVEVKPLRRSVRLYESDRIQIGGYLLALRGSFRDRASNVGYVRYKSATFEVELTRDLESTIRRLVAELRRARSASVLHRSHSSAARCQSCPVQQSCEEKLGARST